MKKQITRISVFQSSKVLAILYVLFGFIYTAIGALMLVLGGQASKGMAIVYILMPVLLGIVGFIFAALGAWVYNLVAQWVGGIEFTVSDIDEE